MSIDAQQALKCETDFLSGVEANFEQAKGQRFRGSIWQRSESDEIDRLKALMASHRRYDREALKSLPANRRVAVHGFDRKWWLWKQKTGVAVASVLSPLEHYAAGEGGDAPPVDLGTLVDHVRRVAEDKSVSYVIGVCSPTGFTDDARSASLEMPNATVVLVEPDARGGWRTMAAGGQADPSLLQIFDPEGAKQKIARVRELISEHSAELITGSLTASAIAREVNLPEHLVRRALEQAAAADPELRVVRKEGQMLLFRGAPVHRQETHSMNVIDRIKQLFAGEGDEGEKINLLAERRATLAQRRDRIYEDIGQLERKEADLLAEGKATKSSVPRRRLAAQLAQMRKDIARQNTTAAMLNKQIDIISTDIHNLTLISQGEAAQLPDTEVLTEHAVRAEEMLETLTADSELVSGLETGIEATLASDEELAILKEFEESQEAPEPASASPQATPEPLRVASQRSKAGRSEASRSNAGRSDTGRSELGRTGAAKDDAPARDREAEPPDANPEAS